MDYGYLQHVAVRENGTRDSFRTEQVKVKNKGAKWLALFMGHWRKVYIQKEREKVFILFQGEKIPIQIQGV